MYYIGIDVGGMSIKAGLIDENGKILAKATCETCPQRDYSKLILDMYTLCVSLAKENKIEMSDISGIGIGSPGSINSAKGVVTHAGNLPFDNVNIVKEFKKFTDIPTYLGNDANCAALGEARFGSGKGAQNAIMITLGTGIGTGFIVDGKILEGKNGAGAEGGHICIKMGGERCTCGERGCWEAYASATALLRITNKAMANAPDSVMNKIAQRNGKVCGTTAFEAYKMGDNAGTKVVKEYIKNISCGLISLVNIFRPDIIMLGGGVSNEGEYFIKMVEKQVRRHSFGGSKNKVCPIVSASLGNDAGIIGAAAIAMINE
jgi:glucokinase